MKFKRGQRVALLDKTCGPIQGLRNLLHMEFREIEKLIPRYGTIESYEKDHAKWGPHYRIIPDNHKSEIHRHRTIMFYEEDLAFEHESWLEDDLFTI